MASCSINNPTLLFYKEARPGGRILYHLRKDTEQKGEGDTLNRNAVFPPSPSPVRGSSPRKDFWGPFNPLQTFLCTFACTQGLPLPCSHSNFHPPYYIFYEKAKTEVHSSPHLCRELARAWLTVTRTSTAWYTSAHTIEQVPILHNLNYIYRVYIENSFSKSETNTWQIHFLLTDWMYISWFSNKLFNTVP